MSILNHILTKQKKPVLLNSLIIIIVNGLALLLYHRINPNKDVERFYHKEDPIRYHLLYLAYTVIMISFVWNIRHFISTCIKFKMD